MLIPPTRKQAQRGPGSLPGVTQWSQNSKRTLTPELSRIPLASCCMASGVSWTKSQLEAGIQDLGQSEDQPRSPEAPSRMRGSQLSQFRRAA